MDRTDQVKAETVLRREGFQVGNGKAWSSGVGGALAVLVIAAIGKYTGAVDIPGADLVAEAIVAIVVAAIAGAGIAWRTWAVPYLSRIAHRSVVLLAMIPIVAACTSIRDSVEAPEAEAFRQGGVYVYAMIPALNYMRAPDARPEIVLGVCGLELPAYAGINAAIAAAEAGSDEVGVALSAAAAALADLDLAVLGGAGVPDLDLSTEELVGRSIILAQVATISIVAMRSWRTGYLTPKLEAMVAEGRAPTPAEWSTLRDRMESTHAAVDGICP